MKEIKLIIPIVNNNGAIQTEVIKGKLHSIVINPLGKTQLKIMSELGYNIYENMEIDKVNYIPIRVQSHDQEGHRIGFSAERFMLNEKLLIQVISFGFIPIESSEVKLIIRYDE